MFNLPFCLLIIVTYCFFSGLRYLFPPQEDKAIGDAHKKRRKFRQTARASKLD